MYRSHLKNFKFAGMLLAFGVLSILSACAGKALVQSPHSASTTERPEILTVAVLDFTNNSIGQSSETSGLGQSFANRIFERLTGQPGIAVLDRESIEKILKELSLSSRGLTESEGRLRLGKLLGAQFLITGSVMAIGGGLRIDARVIEVEKGTVEGMSQDGMLSDRRQIATLLSEKVANKIFKKAGALAAHRPESSQAYLQRGLAFERKNKFDQALKQYQKALSIDPGNQVARNRMEALLLKEME